MKEIVKNRIETLEKNLERVEKKIYPGAPDIMKHAIEAEKIRFAIKQLYICLGEYKE